MLFRGALPILFDDYLHIASVSLLIVRRPLNFSSTISDTPKELAKGLSYLTQAVLLVSLSLEISLGEGPVTQLIGGRYAFLKPYIGELTPALTAIALILVAIFCHRILRSFGAAADFGAAVTVSIFAYWYGILLTLEALIAAVWTLSLASVSLAEISIVCKILSLLLIFGWLAAFCLVFVWISRRSRVGVARSILSVLIAYGIVVAPFVLMVVIGLVLHQHLAVT